MTDFGPLIANPISFLLGAAAQFGIFAAYFIAIALGFNDQAAAAISIIVIRVFKTYRIIIRHMSLTEFTYFVLLAFVKCVLMALIFIAMYGYSFGVVVLIASDFFFSFGAFFALRAMILMIYELFNSKLQEKKKGLNVLVYGVGLKSVSLIPRLKESRHYNIVGFIQFGNVGVSHVISDLKAFYVTSDSEFKNVINAAGADALLFADDEDARIEKERIIKYAIASGVKLLFAPAIDEMVDGKLSCRVFADQLPDDNGHWSSRIDWF